MPFLEVKDLYVSVDNKEILKGCSLNIEEGQVHAVMGPNGSGKSTLANVIAGHPSYQVTKGSIFFKNKNVLEMTPDERAKNGLFLAFQSPIEIPGVSISQFLKTAFNEKLKFNGEKELDAVQFIKRLKTRATALDISDEMLKRALNSGFSGGEKKKMETFQMAFLEPDFCILDEMDAGLDIDALKTVTKAVNVMREANRSFLLITHFRRMLDYIEPDVVHIMIDGKIVHSGDKSLSKILEEKGYDDYK